MLKRQSLNRLKQLEVLCRYFDYATEYEESKKYHEKQYGAIDNSDLDRKRKLLILAKAKIKIAQAKAGKSKLGSVDDLEVKVDMPIDVTILSKDLYSRNINISLPKLKKYYEENYLGKSFHNADKDIMIDVTKESFDETFWGKRNGKNVIWNKPLMIGVHFLETIIKNMKFLSETIDIKETQKNKGGVKIMTFECSLKIDNCIYLYSIPVLVLKTNDKIQYSIRIKSKRHHSNTEDESISSTALKGIGMCLSVAKLHKK